MIKVSKRKRYEVLLSTFYDLIPRILPLITTVFIVSFDTNQRVVDYLFTLGVFNISTVVLNFGIQYQNSTTSSQFKQMLVIQLSLIFLFYCSHYIFDIEQFEEIFTALVLGGVYAHINEFRLRREGKVVIYFLATIFIVVPRALCMFYQFDYYLGSILSSLLLIALLLVFNTNDNHTVCDNGSSVLNFAFLTSILIIIYQQVPSLLSVMEGVDNNERVEQIVIRILFGLMFLKTTLIVLIIKYEFKFQVNKYVFLFFSSSILFVNELLVSFIYAKYLLYVIVFFCSELIYAYCSANFHKNYNYKSMSFDACILMILSISLSLFEFNLIQIYTFSSLGLVLFRYRCLNV